MKLLTVGDSFTYGEELVDRRAAWPYLLSNQLDWSLTNLGRPASGNSRMVRTVVEEIDRHDVFIIAWSHWGRIEFADDHGVYDIWPGSNAAVHQQYSPHRAQLVNYISQHHNDEYLIRQFLLNVIVLQNYLSQKNKRYLMLTAFGYTNLLSQVQDKLKIPLKQGNLSDLLNQIDTRYYVGWPETTMEWTYDLPKGPRGHFLEQ
jgi:hypothetical protein